MKILIVYMSYHHMNTEKIARAMAEVTGATLAKADEVDPGDLAVYDLIGLGSGIYGGKHHTSILALADETAKPGISYIIQQLSGELGKKEDVPLDGWLRWRRHKTRKPVTVYLPHRLVEHVAGGIDVEDRQVERHRTFQRLEAGGLDPEGVVADEHRRQGVGPVAAGGGGEC